MTVKTYDAYFRNKEKTKLYVCSVWANSEEHMKQILKDKFGEVERLAICETNLIEGDVKESENPAPMLIVEEYTTDYNNKNPIKEIVSKEN